MRIPCPYCGERGSHEFVTRGDAGPARPDDDSEEAFHAYLYLRDNPKGLLREHWYHAQGCRNWIVVERDTVSHDIHGATLAKEARR